MEKENKPRKRKDWKCEVCGEKLKKELVLNDIVWAEVCKKANTPNSPRDTLICPECIEKTLGRPLNLLDCGGKPADSWLSLYINIKNDLAPNKVQRIYLWFYSGEEGNELGRLDINMCSGRSF